MKHPFLMILVFAAFFVACGGTATPDPAANPQPEANSQSDATPAPTPEPAAVKKITASFEGAEMYAAATDYHFRDAAGEMITIRVSDMEETPQPQVPADLMVETEDGPMDMNPAMVGKSYEITYNADGTTVASVVAN